MLQNHPDKSSKENATEYTQHLNNAKERALQIIELRDFFAPPPPAPPPATAPSTNPAAAAAARQNARFEQMQKERDEKNNELRKQKEREAREAEVRRKAEARIRKEAIERMAQEKQNEMELKRHLHKLEMQERRRTFFLPKKAAQAKKTHPPTAGGCIHKQSYAANDNDQTKTERKMKKN